MQSCVDSYFTIGSGHTVCQDYVAVSPVLGCALLADGCSGSPNTDTGARLLVHSVLSLLENHWDYYKAVTLGSETALAATRQVGLDACAIDATLLMVELVDDALAMARCYGDGVAVCGTRDGRLLVNVINYPAGYPVYPSYALSATRLQQIRDVPDNHPSIEHFEVLPNGTRTESVMSSSGNSIHTFCYPANDCRFLAVLSDGVETFTCQGNPVPLHEVLIQMLGFKQMHGEFVRRRMNKFRLFCRDAGWLHYDDVSVAALAVLEEA